MQLNTRGLRCTRCGAVVDGFTRDDLDRTTLHCPQCGPVQVMTAAGIALMVQDRIARSQAQGR